MTFHCQTRIWATNKKDYVDDDFVHAFDGESMRLLTMAGGVIDYPFGVVAKDTYHTDVVTPKLRPILMTFRATSSRLAPDRGIPCVLTGRRDLIRGRECLELEVRRTGPDVRRLWIDAERQCSVVRMLTTNNDIVTCRIDVNYSLDSNHGWLPDSWAIHTYLRDGTMAQSVRAKMQSIQFAPEIPRGAFQIAWPVGTYVLDQKNDRDFIQKENGKVRAVSSSELTLTYEELLAKPGPTAWPRLLSWPTLTVACILLISGIFLVIRWRARRNATVSSDE